MRMALGAWPKFFGCRVCETKDIQKQIQKYNIKHIFLWVHEKRNNKILLEKGEQKFLEKSRFCALFGDFRIYSNQFNHIGYENL